MTIKRGMVLMFLSMFLISNVLALPIYVKPLDGSGNLQPSTSFTYVFNFSTNVDCSGVVLTNTSTITTGKDGVGFIDINISGISPVPSYLCEYKDGSLRANHSLSDQLFRDIYARDVNVSGNMSLGQKITFTLGEIIDNIVDGWIRITGNFQVDGDANITGSLNVSENITADYYFGDGSQLTGISTYNATYDDYALNVSINYTEKTVGGYDSRWYQVLWDAVFNASFDDRDDDTTIQNASGCAVGYYLDGSGNCIDFNTTVDDRDSDTTYSALSEFTDDILWTATFNSSFDDRDSDSVFTPTNVAWINESNTFAENQVFNKNFTINTDKFFVDSSTGKVGIGTASPFAKLEVNGSGTLLNIKNDSDSFLFVNETSGRVGIGTTTPSEALEVNGNLRFGAAYMGGSMYHLGDTNTLIAYQSDQIFMDAGGERLIYLIERDTQDYVKLGDGGNVDINLNDMAFLNASSSNFGIGTTNPLWQLDVSNSTQGIIINSTGGISDSPIINTTGTTNLTITSSGGSVIIRLG